MERKLIALFILLWSCILFVSCSSNKYNLSQVPHTYSIDASDDSTAESNEETEHSVSSLQNIITSAVTLIASEKNETVNKYGNLEPYLKYNWVNCNGNLINSKSDKMNGPFFYISMVDLNLDNIPEVIISQKYSDRTIQINDIFSINNNEVTYQMSFYGELGDNIDVLEDSLTKKLYFVCNCNVFQNQTTTKTLILCGYNSDFTSFSCNPQISVNEKDNLIVYRQYKQHNEEANCMDFFSVWDFGENDEITNVLTEHQYEAEYQKIFEGLISLSNSYVYKTNKLIYNLFDDEDMCSSNEEVTAEIEKILNDYILMECYEEPKAEPYESHEINSTDY